MQRKKLTAFIISAVMVLSSVSAYAEWISAGYDKLKTIYLSNTDFILSDFEKNLTLLKDITKKNISVSSYPYGLYGKYFNHLLTKKNFITFSSEERSAVSGNQPHGRFTRSPNSCIKEIIKKIQSKSVFYH